MNKYLTSGICSLLAFGTIITSIPAGAQRRDSDRDGRSDRAEWNRDRDRDGRPDQWDAKDNRRDNRQVRRQRQRLQYYGGNYGYQGYQGRWRTGQRFPNYRQRDRYINNYSAYGLPAPRQGYRYYRADNGDIVMAAVASGLIGLIIGGALTN